MKASIDIGTNTVLLLVAEVEAPHLKVIDEEQRIPRLGAGVDDSKELSPEAMQRVIESINEFQQITDKNYPEVDEIYVTATSAVRDATNKADFLDLVEQETGLQVQVLSGVEEAEYTFLGAQSVLNGDEDLKLVIDIGGGSTELAYGQKELHDRYSYDMGCVRFTERYLTNDLPTESQMRSCRDAIQNMLNDYTFDVAEQSTLIGVAGTVTSLAFIDIQLDSYDGQLLAGHVLSFDSIGSYIDVFKKYSSAELENCYPNVLKGRADIFLAGLLILEGFMKRYDFKELIISTGGIRHGTILAKNTE